MITREDLEEKLLYQFKSDHELVQSLEELNLIFTRQRHRLKEYGESERLVSAYVLFYGATNVPKLKFLLDKLPANLLESLRQQPLIDFGSGPGTFLLAWRDYWQGAHGPMFGVETSPLMRKQAKKLLGEEVQISERVPSLKGATLLFGHSANELDPAYLLKLIEELDPRVILFIEPGTKEVFQKFLKTRRILLNTYTIHYPCSVSGPCPLEEKDDWCHQIVEARHDPSIERITQLAHRDRRTLPTLFQVFVKEGKQQNLLPVVTRVFPQTKFSYEFEVCVQSEEKNELRKIQVMKKGLAKSEQKMVDKISSGNFVNVAEWFLLSDGKWRVTITC